MLLVLNRQTEPIYLHKKKTQPWNSAALIAASGMHSASMRYAVDKHHEHPSLLKKGDANPLRSLLNRGPACVNLSVTNSIFFSLLLFFNICNLGSTACSKGNETFSRERKVEAIHVMCPMDHTAHFLHGFRTLCVHSLEGKFKLLMASSWKFHIKWKYENEAVS